MKRATGGWKLLSQSEPLTPYEPSNTTSGHIQLVKFKGRLGGLATVDGASPVNMPTMEKGCFWPSVPERRWEEHSMSVSKCHRLIGIHRISPVSLPTAFVQ